MFARQLRRAVIEKLDRGMTDPVRGRTRAAHAGSPGFDDGGMHGDAIVGRLEDAGDLQLA